MKLPADETSSSASHSCVSQRLQFLVEKLILYSAIQNDKWLRIHIVTMGNAPENLKRRTRLHIADDGQNPSVVLHVAVPLALSLMAGYVTFQLSVLRMLDGPDAVDEG